MDTKQNSIKNTGKHGGRRIGSGRKPGSRNKTTIALKEMANRHTEQALSVLVEIMQDPEAPHAARVSAANGVLDRGHGKPTVNIEPVEVKISPIPWDELREISRKSMEEAERRHLEIIEGRYERLGIKQEYYSD